jgi:hypothetical protein
VIVRGLRSRREKKVSAGWQSSENGRKKNGGRHNGRRRKDGSRMSCEKSNGHAENRRSHRVSTSESGNSCNVNERSSDGSEQSGNKNENEVSFTLLQMNRKRIVSRELSEVRMMARIRD